MSAPQTNPFKPGDRVENISVYMDTIEGKKPGLGTVVEGVDDLGRPYVLFDGAPGKWGWPARDLRLVFTPNRPLREGDCLLADKGHPLDGWYIEIIEVNHGGVAYATATKPEYPATIIPDPDFPSLSPSFNSRTWQLLGIDNDFPGRADLLDKVVPMGFVSEGPEEGYPGTDGGYNPHTKCGTFADPVLTPVEQAEGRLLDLFEQTATDAAKIIAVDIVPHDPTRGLFLLENTAKHLAKLRRPVDLPRVAVAAGPPGNAGALHEMVGLLREFYERMAPKPEPTEPKVRRRDWSAPSLHELQDAVRMAQGLGDEARVEAAKEALRKALDDTVADAMQSPGTPPPSGVLLGEDTPTPEAP